MENLLSDEHTLISAAAMMSIPSPRQSPWTAAMTGTRHREREEMAFWKSCGRRSEAKAGGTRGRSVSFGPSSLARCQRVRQGEAPEGIQTET